MKLTMKIMDQYRMACTDPKFIDDMFKSGEKDDREIFNATYHDSSTMLFIAVAYYGWKLARCNNKSCMCGKQNNMNNEVAIQAICSILERFGEHQANLTSDAARKTIAVQIIKALDEHR